MGLTRKRVPWEKGYKVLDSKRTSPNIKAKWATVQYEKGKPAVPQKGCGPLTVFANLKDASAFYELSKSKMGRTIVSAVHQEAWARADMWVVEFQRAKAKTVWIPGKDIPKIVRRNFLDGTVLARKVRLLEKLKPIKKEAVRGIEEERMES